MCPEEHIFHSNIRGPPPFFYSDTNPVLGHIVVHSVDKTHGLVVTLELIWLFLNISSFNFVSAPNKSLRFTRFRRSYVNHPAVVPIKFTLLFFCLMCSVQSGHVPFSCSCLSPMIVHLRTLYLSTPVARMKLTQRWISRRKDVI